MAEKQPLSSGKTEHALPAPAEILEQPVEASPFLAGLLQGQGVPPPIKPRPQDVVHMQRLIGNKATRHYLSPRMSISTGASSLHVQRDRVVEDAIDLSLPAHLMPYDAFVDLLSHNRALRSRMIARSDATHIPAILSEHSNLEEIYRQIRTLYSAGGDPGSIQLHIQLHYEDVEGSAGERVDHIDFSLPGVTITDFEDEGSTITVPRPDPDEPSFGLESSGSRGMFVEEALTILIPDWADMPVVDRVIQLFNMVNRRLMAIGVPMIFPSPQSGLPPGTRAQFDSATWSVEYVDALIHDAHTPDEINRLISDFYHEGRHAEQAFLALRYFCQIAGPLDHIFSAYPLHIRDAAEAANARTPLAGAELEEGRQHYELLIGNEAATQAVYDKADAAAQEVLDLRARHAPPEEIEAAVQRYLRADAAYRALTGEADAFDVGGEVRAQLNDANPPN